MTQKFDSEITQDQLLDELAAQMSAARPVRRPGGVTANELAKRSGGKRESCRDFLERQVEAGRMTRERCLDGGMWVVAYHPDNKKPAD